MSESKQHVQVPTMDLKAEGLLHTDPYIYACIKKYMNISTKKAWPSNSTLVKISGLSPKTIIDAVRRLETAGYFSVEREYGKSNVYTFNDYKKFEIFSYDFLDRQDLTPKDKALFITLQPLMFKNQEIGTITYSTKELADKIALSVNTLKKHEAFLRDKGLIDIVAYKTDNATGLPVHLRTYDFEKWSNLIALKFIEQDDRLNDHDHQIKRLEDEIEFLKKELAKRDLKDRAEIVQPIVL